MGARLGVVIGALVVAALLAAGYFLFWQEEPQPQRAEAPVVQPAPERPQPEAPAAGTTAPSASKPEEATPPSAGTTAATTDGAGTGAGPAATGEAPTASAPAEPQPREAAPAGEAQPQEPEDAGRRAAAAPETEQEQAPRRAAEPAPDARTEPAPQTAAVPGTAPASPDSPGGPPQPATVAPEEAAPRSAAPAPKPQAARPEAARPEAARPEAAPPEAAPREAAPPEATPPKAAPPEAVPAETAPAEVAPPAVAPREVAPREAAPAEPAPSGQVAALPSRQAAEPEPREATTPGLPGRTVPSFDVVHVERSGSAVIAGRAEPGSRVTVLRNGEELGRADTNAAGEWVFLTDRPLAPGDHQLSLVARGRDGREIEAPRVVVVSVPKPELQVARPAGAPEGAEPVEPGTVEPRGPVAVALDKSGEGDVVVLQGIDAGVAVGDLVLETLRYDAEGRVTVTGKVAPEGRVFAYIDDAFVGEARGDAQGAWRLRAAEPVSMGLHRLRLDQVDAGGEVLARLETPFARSSLLTDLPEGERLVIVQPGNSLWRIAQRTLGQGLRYTVIFEANESQIRNPDLIYPGQVFVVPEDEGPPS